MPVSQEQDCLIWELARESRTMREEIEIRRKSTGSYILNEVTTIKFTAERFCSCFKFLLEHFPLRPDSQNQYRSHNWPKIKGL